MWGNDFPHAPHRYFAAAPLTRTAQSTVGRGEVLPPRILSSSYANASSRLAIACFSTLRTMKTRRVSSSGEGQASSSTGSWTMC